MDTINGNVQGDGKILKLPKTFTKIDISSLKNKKLKMYLEKRKLSNGFCEAASRNKKTWYSINVTIEYDENDNLYITNRDNQLNKK